MILLIDNIDSFVYNLARYVGELGFDRLVKRNNELSIEDIKQLKPEKIILSPGPKGPLDAGISLDIIKYLGADLPILGVCLGHQAIGHAFGGVVTHAKNPQHGKSSWITHDGKGIFKNLSNPLKVARYHSLIVNEEDFPEDLQITARAENGEIMALQHRLYPIYGVQFHPESILTMQGHLLLQNFLSN